MENWLLLDADKSAGGLSASVSTKEGFRFDHGFQTLTSNYDYFDKMLDSLQSRSQRSISFQESKTFSAVLYQDKMIPYPIQGNLEELSSRDKVKCATDLITSRLRGTLEDEQEAAGSSSSNLNEYLVTQWGESLCNIFFRPYIYKSWAYPTEKMTHDWAVRRIPNVDVTRIVKRLLDADSGDEDDKGRCRGFHTFFCYFLSY